MPAPKSTPKPLTGMDAVAELQRQVSAKGVAKAEANARKAIDNKYPGLYVPAVRTTPGVKKK
jgi:hypothetical protein